MRSYFLTQDTADWEIAFVHTIDAHAAWAAGTEDRYRDSYQAAVIAIATIADPEDREIVVRTFNQVPAP